jgi:AMP deaminase
MVLCRLYILIRHRIDRYTRAAQAGSHDLTSSNLQSEVPQTPKSFQGVPHPASPTHASAGGSKQFFSMLPPAQVARLKPTGSTTDGANTPTQPASPTSAHDGSNAELPHRSAGMTANTNAVSAGQQPAEGQGQSALDEADTGLRRSTSSVTLDGEPRLFPGIVSSRSRRRSTKTNQAEDGDPTSSRLKRYPTGETESVMEERDTDDE